MRQTKTPDKSDSAAAAQIAKERCHSYESQQADPRAVQIGDGGWPSALPGATSP